MPSQYSFHQNCACLWFGGGILRCTAVQRHKEIVIMHVERIDQVPRVEGSDCQVTVQLVLFFPKTKDIASIDVGRHPESNHEYRGKRKGRGWISGIQLWSLVSMARTATRLLPRLLRKSHHSPHQLNRRLVLNCSTTGLKSCRPAEKIGIEAALQSEAIVPFYSLIFLISARHSALPD